MTEAETENLRRAQLLADTAFDLLMWNPNGDGTTYTPRPITDRDRGKVEDLTALSQAYSILVAATVTLVVETGEGWIMNSDEQEI